MIRIVLAVALSIALAPPTMSGEFASSVDTANVSERSQTTLGLYLTARDAAAALEMDPGIVLVDVRTRAEFSYAGHADPVDQNIPLRFFSDRFDEKSGAYLYDDNENFLRDFAALMDREGKGSDDPIFVMCRSGGRSAAAVNALAAAGYTKVYNVVDGFEGGKDKATGHRTVDGWRNAGLPWGYRIAPGAAYSPR